MERADLIKIDMESLAQTLSSADPDAKQDAFCGDHARDIISEISKDIPEYISFCEINHQISINGKAVRLCGKAHGVFQKDSDYYIDFAVQYKKYRAAFNIIANLIAYIIIKKKGAKRIYIRFISREKGEISISLIEKSFAEAESDFANYLEYIAALLPLYDKNEKTAVFPYKELREGQKTLIKAVWNAIKSKSSLYASAPTGIGKTLAVLYPSLKAMESGRAKKVIYAAPKNTLKKQAADAVSALQPSENKFVTLVLDAKMSLCPENNEECDFFNCPLGLGTRDNIAEAIKLLADKKSIGADELTEAAKLSGVCPFELGLNMIKFADMIICDYNYIFDPRISLEALKGNDTVLLCDESHNLPDRIKEAYSESISPADIDFFFKEKSLYTDKIKAHFENLTRIFELNRIEYSEKKRYFSKLPDPDLFEECKAITDKILMTKAMFAKLSEREERETKKLLTKLRKFNFLANIFSDEFRMLNYEDGGKKIYPVDISGIVEKAKSRFGASVFFSATLSPKEYYSLVLHKDDSDKYLELPSPFERDNLFIGISDINVSYQERFGSARKLCSIINNAISTKKGNYFVFLPSFEYLDFIVQEYKRSTYKNTVIFQKRKMSYAERKAYLDEFSKPRKDSLVAFAVLGGVFGEGIDLVGDKLSGEVIVGTGFPPPSLEKEAESDYYNEKELSGKSLSYTLPGFNKVLQAAGRVIRSENDRGFAILCDNRYLSEDIKELFPEHWDIKYILSDKELTESLLDFWS